MKFKTPLLWRFYGTIKNIIDNYSYSNRFLSKNRNKNIFFIQIGANDGISQDPIYKYSQNWDGILIEPIPEIFENLKRNYSRSKRNLIFENIAISDYNGEINLYLPKTIDPDNWQTKLASTNKEAGMLNNFELQEIKVPCLSLDSLIKKYNIKEIDLLVIDIEGQEKLLFDNYSFLIKPKAIFFEIRFYSYDVLVKMYAKFIKLGYRIFPERDNVLLILK